MERENGKRGELFKTPSSLPSIDRSNARALPFQFSLPKIMGAGITMTIPDNDARITNKNKTIIERRGHLLVNRRPPPPGIAACSITLSIRDIGRGTRLRAAAASVHAEVHASRALLHEPDQSHARRPWGAKEGPVMILAPLNSILEELRELREGEEIEGRVEGDRIAAWILFPRFILRFERAEDVKGCVERYIGEKGREGCSLVRREGSRARCLMFYACVYIRVQLETGKGALHPTAVIFITLLATATSTLLSVKWLLNESFWNEHPSPSSFSNLAGSFRGFIWLEVFSIVVIRGSSISLLVVHQST